MEHHLPSGSDDKSDLGFWFNEEIAFFLGFSLSINDFLSLVLVLPIVFLSVGKDKLSLFNSLFLGSNSSFS
jgi:hypothetical protein